MSREGTKAEGRKKGRKEKSKKGTEAQRTKKAGEEKRKEY